MQIESGLNKKQYLSAMKESMEGHFAIGKERFTGFFLGNAFTVTHHCGYEWNRRVTNQKHTALGFVKDTQEGCIVRCIWLPGLLAPTQFLFTLSYLLAAMFMALLIEGQIDRMPAPAYGFVALFALAVTALAALISAITDTVTEAGREGANSLMALLMDPSDPFSYTHNIK